MCYNFATFVLYLDVITLIYRENRLTSSETCLSAERAGQKWSANGQKATNQRFVAFFIARKSCFQDFKSTVKDKVSLLNRYLFPAGQKR